MTYSVASYNQMIADRVRTDAHTRAAQATIKPGSVVAELGTGNGYFAALACKLGARKVYAIENDKIIDAARLVARQNGCSETIEFIQALSINVTLPEKADVIFSDLRGALPFFQQNITSVIDARERLLKPGGTMVPQKDDIYAAFVSSPTLYAGFTEPEAYDADAPDLSPLRPVLRNIVKHSSVQAADCVSEPLLMGTVDYRTITDPTFRSVVNWVAPRDATTHGVCTWFDATLTDGVQFSTGPYSPGMIYGRLLFPFAEPVTVSAGDTATFAFEALFVGDDYVWRWSTVVVDADGNVKSHLRQSSFESTNLGTVGVALRKSGEHVPSMTKRHDLTKFVLERIDGSRNLDAIARDLVSTFPDDFPQLDKAVNFAGEVVERNG